MAGPQRAAIGPLLEQGRLEELRAHMLRLWPVELVSAPDDIAAISLVTALAGRDYGDRAADIYATYSSVLKSDPGDRDSLNALSLRAQAISKFEGAAAATAWLRRLTEVVPPPDVGVVYLTLGRLLLVERDLQQARRELRMAVQFSLIGPDWYGKEAIGAMTMCLVAVGELRLAFEYARAQVVKYYTSENVSEQDLYESLKGLASTFGQLDYWMELERNVADERARRVACRTQLYTRANWRCYWLESDPDKRRLRRCVLRRVMPKRVAPIPTNRLR